MKEKEQSIWRCKEDSVSKEHIQFTIKQESGEYIETLDVDEYILETAQGKKLVDLLEKKLEEEDDIQFDIHTWLCSISGLPWKPEKGPQDNYGMFAHNGWLSMYDVDKNEPNHTQEVNRWAESMDETIQSRACPKQTTQAKTNQRIFEDKIAKLRVVQAEIKGLFDAIDGIRPPD